MGNNDTINHNICGVNTNSCIAGDQFARLKKGDRYFYDLSGHPGQLSAAQLAEVRRASMARILCDNSGVSQMQPLAFLGPESFNPVISCEDSSAIPRPGLEPWRENGRG